MSRGQVVAIYTAPETGAPMESGDGVEATAGVGLDGDRYAAGEGKYTRSDDDGKRAITLIEREAVAAAGREYEIEIGEHEARRNLVTEGVPLNHLVGRTFTDGDVRMRGVKLSEPCAYLERLTHHGVRKALIDRAGLRAEILDAADITVADTVSAN